MGINIKNLKEDFFKLISNDIESRSVKVARLMIGEPVSEKLIKETEERLGFSLDENIKNFYRQINGLIYYAYTLEHPSDDESGNRGSSEFVDWDQFLETEKPGWSDDDDEETLKRIYILPFEEVFSGEQNYLLDECEEYSPEYYDEDTKHQELYLLDGWSDFYPIMLEIDYKKESFSVLKGDDYGACWDEYPKISFEDYLKQIFSSDLAFRIFEG